VRKVFHSDGLGHKMHTVFYFDGLEGRVRKVFHSDGLRHKMRTVFQFNGLGRRVRKVFHSDGLGHNVHKACAMLERQIELCHSKSCC
jgi:hypothetical protein